MILKQYNSFYPVIT